MNKKEETEQNLDKLRAKDPKSIPLVVLEMAQCRNERREKRHFIIEVILIALLVLSNIIWIIYSSQFTRVIETTTDTDTVVEQQAEEYAYSTIGYGDVLVYGKAKD